MRTPILFAALLATALVADTGPGVAAAPVTAPVNIAAAAPAAPADREITLDVLELI